MCNYLASKLSLWLFKHHAIREHEVEEYRYASYLIIFTALPVIPVILIGLFLHVPVHCSLIYSVVFILLRRFTGGLHFKSAGFCYLFSTMIETVFLYLAHSVDLNNRIISIYIICCIRSCFTFKYT